METRDWYAWYDLMPGKPVELHVTGEVLVGNPGIQAQLRAKEPQGINPRILLLDLFLVQQPGIRPQVLTWGQARYAKVKTPTGEKYTDIEVFHENVSLTRMKVKDVQ